MQTNLVLTGYPVIATIHGDSSAASSLLQAEVDEMVRLFLDMEDPELIAVVVDLRTRSRQSKFDVFWDECAKFLQGNIGLAVDERRHSQVTHMATAISVRDLCQQVSARCPPSTAIRKAAGKNPELRSAVLDSVAPVKILLSTIFQRLELKGQKFSIFSPASEEDLVQMWSELNSVDSTLEYGQVYRMASLSGLVQLDKFLNHCCHSRHYSFSIKKCGEESCTICRPVRMRFGNLSWYSPLAPFSDVYGTSTNEQYRPSLQARKGRQKTLSFSASVQHVKNVDIMLQCEEFI